MQGLFTIGGVLIGILIAVRRSVIQWIKTKNFDEHKVNRFFGAVCKIPLPTNFKESFIKLNSLNIYDDEQLKVELIYRYLERYVFAAILLMAILVINNNFVHFVTMLPIAFLFCESLHQQFVDDIYLKFLSQLDQYCQRLTTSYNRTFNVSKTMEEVVADAEEDAE